MAPIARFGPLKIWQQKYFVKHSEPGLGCFLNPFCSEDLKISEEGGVSIGSTGCAAHSSEEEAQEEEKTYFDE